MKRSSTDKFTKNKKLCLSTSPNNTNKNNKNTTAAAKPITSTNSSTSIPITPTLSPISTATNSNNNNKMTNVLEQIKDMVLHLDKGDLEYCITRSLTTEMSIPADQHDDQHTEEQEEAEEENISILLHKALRNIAQRQLKLETENKRYRIAIKQQHHLLTHDDCNSKKSKEEDESIVNINKIIDNGTPEDCISSFRQSPMLEKLQLTLPGKKSRLE
jgi:hypothetical protein